MDQLYFVLQIVLSIVLGGILGFQRERIGKPAGPRTYALATAGSTLFTILSMYGFGSDSPGRIASNIVVGIGFLGAGLIFQREDHVANLTTAAGLWATAAIGMAVGVRYYVLAVVTTALMLILFMFDDQRFKRKSVNDANG